MASWVDWLFCFGMYVLTRAWIVQLLGEGGGDKRKEQGLANGWEGGGVCVCVFVRFEDVCLCVCVWGGGGGKFYNVR